MSDLPNNPEVWASALKDASESNDVTLTTAGILDHIRHLIVIGQLVNREDMIEERVHTLDPDLDIDYIQHRWATKWKTVDE